LVPRRRGPAPASVAGPAAPTSSGAGPVAVAADQDVDGHVAGDDEGAAERRQPAREPGQLAVEGRRDAVEGGGHRWVLARCPKPGCRRAPSDPIGCPRFVLPSCSALLLGGY